MQMATADYVSVQPIGGEFERELAALLNRYSKENESNTPDFQLARYLVRCLDAFNETVRFREGWYGRNPDHGPGQGGDIR